MECWKNAKSWKTLHMAATFSLILPTFYTGFTLVISRKPFILPKTPWYVLFRLQRTVFLVTYDHVVFDFIRKPAQKCLIRYFCTDKHICNHECAAWKTKQLKREINCLSRLPWSDCYVISMIKFAFWKHSSKYKTRNLTCNWQVINKWQKQEIFFSVKICWSQMRG